jgi:hypothetical protein
MDATTHDERYPRTAGGVACDEPGTGRPWVTRWLTSARPCSLGLIMARRRRSNSAGAMCAQRGMALLRIAVTDVFDDGPPCFVARLEVHVVDALDLHGAVDRFHRRVVPAIALATHRHRDAARLQPLSVVLHCLGAIRDPSDATGWHRSRANPMQRPAHSAARATTEAHHLLAVRGTREVDFVVRERQHPLALPRFRNR